MGGCLLKEYSKGEYNMRGSWQLWFSLPLLMALLLAGTAGAADIQPGLDMHLQDLADDDMVSVILTMTHQAPIAELNASLKQSRSSLSNRHETVVLALKEASMTQTDLLSTLTDKQDRSSGVEGFTSYWISNLVVAKISKATLYELAERDDIDYIEPNFTVSLIEPTKDPNPAPQDRSRGATIDLRAINADRCWYELGITGAGVLVANCDTGVDGNHPALSSRWRGNNGHPASECWLSLIGNDPNFPTDTNDHGTHVMGTITGLGAATEDTIGVAWNAMWIATDPINQGVSTDFNNDIITAFQWFSDPDGDPFSNDDVPDVVQNSWRVNEGFPGGYTDCDDRWWAAIDNCEAAGVVTTWSAGNEGYGSPETIGSPADRATTLTSGFAVGSVDSHNYSFPYPISDFSSLGPTGCDVPADHKIKPEICAGGTGIYSSVPGGGYEGGWNGTSMSGPHVAGVVALMREAAPDLDVDTIKEVIMETARDLGTPGEDNTFGWGVIDAYEAVLAVSGNATLDGEITNAYNGDTPVPGATITVVEANRTTMSDDLGAYTMNLDAGVYTVSVTHPSFAGDTANNVYLYQDLTTTQSFSLIDIGAPQISNTTQLPSTDDAIGPYVVTCDIFDYSALTSTTLFYRLGDMGDYTEVAMANIGGNTWQGSIPGMPINSLVQYLVGAEDVAGNEAFDPSLISGDVYSFYVAAIESVHSDDMESGAPGYTHYAGSGFGDQWHLSTQRNSTPGGGTSWKCGDAGAADYDNLLDAQLVTPVFDLAIDSYLEYWQWIDAEASGSFPGMAYDGGRVEISVNSGTWEQIFPVGGYSYQVRPGGTPGPFAADTWFFSGSADWQQIRFELGAYEGTAQLRFRFGSDGGSGGEGWYVDDVAVNGFVITLHAVEDDDVAASKIRFRSIEPNPFTMSTTLSYELPTAMEVSLQIFDTTGRLVRTLANGQQTAGTHHVSWDGLDGNNSPVPGGVYLSRFTAGNEVQTRKVIMTR
jgi:subtilisin family serine protease